MTASQHIGRAIQSIHAQLRKCSSATYVGSHCTIEAKYSSNGAMLYRVTRGCRTSSTRGVGAAWAALEHEWMSLEAIREESAEREALELARARDAKDILATYREQGASALALGLPMDTFTQVAVDRITDAGFTRANASAMVDEVTDALVNAQWAAAVAELPEHAAPREGQGSPANPADRVQVGGRPVRVVIAQVAPAELDPVAELKRAAALAQQARDEAQSAMWAAQGAAAMARDQYELAQGHLLDVLGRYESARDAVGGSNL